MDANLVAAVTAIAALLTGIATFLSIREMRLQRRVQYHPELVVQDLDLRAVRRADPSSREIAFAPIEGPLTNGDPWRGDVPISVHNVGSGVARDVEASWSFDRLAFAKLLAPFENALGGPLRVGNDLIQRGGESSMRWFVSGPSRSERLGAIVPVSNGGGKAIVVDSAYCQLLREFYLVYSLDAEAPLVPPPLYLTLRFRDIEGRRYQKTFRFTLRLSYSSRIHDDDTSEYHTVGLMHLLADDA